MRRLPPLKALRAFEAAARSESLTIAADELSVSHSAVSQQVKILEEYFGQRLFERAGRNLKLTPKARAYFEDVRACLDRIAVASELLMDQSVRNIIRVNATPSFAMRWLIPNLPTFQLQYPGIEVRVSTSPMDTIDQLNDTFDFIIRRDHMRRSGYICERFLDDVSGPVISPLLQKGAPVTSTRDIQTKTLLHLKSRPDAWARWFEAAGLPVGETLQGPYFDHFFLSLQAAINGLGIALAPEALIKDDLEQGRLIQLFPEFKVEGPGFHCLYRSDGNAGRHIQVMLEWLREQNNL